MSPKKTQLVGLCGIACLSGVISCGGKVPKASDVEESTSEGIEEKSDGLIPTPDEGDTGDTQDQDSTQSPESTSGETDKSSSTKESSSLDESSSDASNDTQACRVCNQVPDSGPGKELDPYQLWILGAFRGANIYQQDEGRDDGASNRGFGPPIKTTDLTGLRACCANLVQFSIPGIYHVKEAKEWPQMANHMIKLVKWAADAGLYVVLSYRTGPGRGEGDITGDGLSIRSVFETQHEQAGWVQMWKKTVQLLQEHKLTNVVGYDLMVEPHDLGANIEQWRNLAWSIVRGIRELDAKTPILISPGNWGTVSGLSSFTPIGNPEDRLIYTVHQYAPYEFSHECEERELGELRREVDNLYSTIEKWEKDNDRNVVVTEMGYNVDQCKGQNHRLYMQHQIEKLNSLSMSHVAWIWEVEGFDFIDFDFKRDPELMFMFYKEWQKNLHYPR